MSQMQNLFEGTLSGLNALDAESSFRIISALCDYVRSHTENVVQCWPAPGYVTDLGQEYKIILKGGDPGVEHLLLRAHIPATGFPVRLDLYDEDLIECRTEDDLHQQLRMFLERETTRNVISVLRQAGLHFSRRNENSSASVNGNERPDLGHTPTRTIRSPAVVSSLCFGTAVLLGGTIVLYQTASAAPLLWALACLSSGGMLGFLFGIPRGQFDAAPGVRNPKTDAVNQVNTNLELVSDWLTKIIVGLILIHLSAIPGHVQELAAHLVEDAGPGRLSRSSAAAQIVYFIVLGFVCGYVSTRYFIGEPLRRRISSN